MEYDTKGRLHYVIISLTRNKNDTEKSNEESKESWLII